MRYALRVSLLDKPGSLSGLTAALTRVGADVVTLEVVDRGDGIAVDDLAVEAEAGARELRAAVEQVPGMIVESLRKVEAFPDPGAPIALAALVVEQGKGAVARLVEGLPEALQTSWALAVASGFGGLEPLAASGGSPHLEGLELPWLPLPGPRRLERAEWMPATWRAAMVDGLELAAAPLGRSATAVLVGRASGPRFRSSELRQLADLARVAVATEVNVAAEPVGVVRRPRPGPAVARRN